MSNTMKSIVHGVVSGALFLLPIIMVQGHTYTDLTIGAVLNAVYHWLVLYNSTPSAN